VPITGTNLFQSQLDKAASPLLTTPSPLKPPAPTAAPASGLGESLSGLGGGLDLGKLLGGLGGGISSPRPAVPAPLKATPARAPASTSPGWVSGVVRAAREAGIPEQNIPLAVSFALEESGGNARAVGDQGSSYGLFQLHKGGALGNLTPQQAFDPYTNAGVVMRAWGKLGGGRGMAPAQAAMDYYSRVGRGSSNEIPVRNALAKLDQAKALVAGVGGGGGAQTLMERTASGGTPGAGGLSPGTFGALLSYAMKIQKEALAGKAPDLHEVMQMADPIMRAVMTPTAEVQTGQAPPTDPGSSGREQVAASAALSLLGLPYIYGGNDPLKGVDCSRLIQYAWGKAGVSLPRTTFDQIKAGVPVPNLASAQKGDLLFPSEHHVLLYLGGGRAVESPHTGARVRETSVAGRTFLAIRRPG
jgi:cell wall-associated NlpC family hydrolase